MKLSEAQVTLLQQLGSNVDKGLTTDEASARREQDGSFNVVDPPINCPAWVCCLLPCIKHVPAMKVFQQVKPDDAEVMRNGKWIRYDATSLVKGDIIRLEEGDIVPADCTILSLEQESTNTDLLVDHRYVTGEDKPRSSSIMRNDNTAAQPVQLFYGGQVVQGAAIGVVTAIGPNTLLASLIREKRFPPKENVLLEQSDGIFVLNNNNDEEAGISLIT